MTSSSALCSITLHKPSTIPKDEAALLKHEITSFVSPFVNETFTSHKGKSVQISFECNHQALPLLHDYLFSTKAYDEQYSLDVNFKRL